MNEPKNKNNTIIDVNLKTRYKPFKRSFKRPFNKLRLSIKRIINYGFYRKTPATIHSNSRGGNKRLRYASIKGCCGLQRNGFLR